MQRSRRPRIHAALAGALGLLFMSVTVLGGVAASDAVASGPSPAGADFGTHDRATTPAKLHTTWTWPLPGRHVIARAFLAPPHAYGPGHRGVDLRADAPASAEPARIDVLAPADGVVAYAGTVADRALLTIDHGGELVSTLEPVDATVISGQRVARGETVGILSGGGHAAAGTLHLGARIAGEYVNPLLFLGGLERARLLPLP